MKNYKFSMTFNEIWMTTKIFSLKTHSFYMRNLKNSFKLNEISFKCHSFQSNWLKKFTFLNNIYNLLKILKKPLNYNEKK